MEFIFRYLRYIALRIRFVVFSRMCWAVSGTSGSGELPVTSPAIWAAMDGGAYGSPPAGWKCDRLRYYESDPNHLNASFVTCDCGCGVIDPDCGYIPDGCENQTWNPVYTALECEGNVAPASKLYCRMETARCMSLPPGLHFHSSTPNSWTCIPDVYFELSDEGTSLNDCDCACGDVDPDCQLLYNNIYCADHFDENGVLLPRSWADGPTCIVDETHGNHAYCKDKSFSGALECPQLPPLAPSRIVKPGAGKGKPPPGWTCAPGLYYESEGSTGKLAYSCDCGCGVIDPDCGYVLQSCDDQAWNPRYSKFTCEGAVLDKEMMYCRLESARCTPLPPGIHERLWTCIPDAYHELSDNMTSHNDCDCNCGSLDPDCGLEYNNLNCLVNREIISVPRQKATFDSKKGIMTEATCTYQSSQTGATCFFKEIKDVEKAASEQCPQLPVTAPKELARMYGAAFGRPPSLWTCDPARYYELDPINTLLQKEGGATCDCGCGVVDPDCGYIPQSCFNQTWTPSYSALECRGEPAPLHKIYCRLDSTSCMRLPPGLHFHTDNKPNTWTCIPDVYHELSDPGTSLNDCDCNCGDLDPDCQLMYNNIYCGDHLDENGVPLPLSWDNGEACVVDSQSGIQGAHCQNQFADGQTELYCPQLPPFLPRDLVKPGARKGKPPPEWTCAPEAYYESQGGHGKRTNYSCDCGCGVIDPDCGYVLQSCSDQVWNPSYSTFKCEGAVLDKDMMYCRLQSARCTTVPPGIHDNLWTCIPDVYHELSDNLTKLNDCDCNCGSLDPDCLLDYNNLYCAVNGKVTQVLQNAAVCAYTSRQAGAECKWIPEEIELNRSAAIAVWALAALCGAICLVFVYHVVHHRKTRLIKASSFAFSVVLILACGGVCVSIVLFALPPNPNQVVPHAIRFKDMKVAALVAGFVLSTGVVLAIFFLVDPPFYQLNQFTATGGPSALAYRVRNLPTVFNESKLIAWLLYNTVFLGLVGIAVDFILAQDQLTGKMMLRAFTLLIGALTPVFVLYLPKLIIIWKEQANDSKYVSGSTSNSNNTNPSRNKGAGIKRSHQHTRQGQHINSNVEMRQLKVESQHMDSHHSRQGKMQKFVKPENRSHKSAASGLSDMEDDGEGFELQNIVLDLVSEDNDHTTDMGTLVESAKQNNRHLLDEYQRAFPQAMESALSASSISPQSASATLERRRSSSHSSKSANQQGDMLVEDLPDAPVRVVSSRTSSGPSSRPGSRPGSNVSSPEDSRSRRLPQQDEAKLARESPPTATEKKESPPTTEMADAPTNLDLAVLHLSPRKSTHMTFGDLNQPRLPDSTPSGVLDRSLPFLVLTSSPSQKRHGLQEAGKTKLTNSPAEKRRGLQEAENLEAEKTKATRSRSADSRPGRPSSNEEITLSRGQSHHSARSSVTEHTMKAPYKKGGRSVSLNQTRSRAKEDVGHAALDGSGRGQNGNSAPTAAVPPDSSQECVPSRCLLEESENVFTHYVSSN
eukprot:g3445.t1